MINYKFSGDTTETKKGVLKRLENGQGYFFRLSELINCEIFDACMKNSFYFSKLENEGLGTKVKASQVLGIKINNNGERLVKLDSKVLDLLPVKKITKECRDIFLSLETKELEKQEPEKAKVLPAKRILLSKPIMGKPRNKVILNLQTKTINKEVKKVEVSKVVNKMELKAVAANVVVKRIMSFKLPEMVKHKERVVYKTLIHQKSKAISNKISFKARVLITILSLVIPIAVYIMNIPSMYRFYVFLGSNLNAGLMTIITIASTIIPVVIFVFFYEKLSKDWIYFLGPLLLIGFVSETIIVIMENYHSIEDTDLLKISNFMYDFFDISKDNKTSEFKKLKLISIILTKGIFVLIQSIFVKLAFSNFRK